MWHLATVYTTAFPLTSTLRLFPNHVFFHLRALRHIRHTLTDDGAKTIASSLFGSRLDYANAVLVGMSIKYINRLQHIQNTLARIGMKVPHDQTRNVSTKHLLSPLHWLPVRRRIYHICNEELGKNKVCDHCHLSGKFRGAAHDGCNLKYKVPKFFPVVCHNLSGYDSHLLLKHWEIANEIFLAYQITKNTTFLSRKRS